MNGKKKSKKADAEEKEDSLDKSCHDSGKRDMCHELICEDDEQCRSGCCS